MTEKVAMRHPDLKHTTETPVLVSEASFKAVWEKQGWQIAAKKHQPQEEETE